MAQNKFQFLSGSALKLIAVFCMLIDHTASVLVGVIPLLSVPFPIGTQMFSLYRIMRLTGRLSFPLFCF